MQSVSQSHKLQFCKIMVVGNIAGGKTALSRSLAALYDLPLTHVDTIQFGAGMTLRPHAETRAKLREVAQQEKWLIDGFGPLDLIEERFQLADKIVFVDLPLWRHAWWCTKRQISNLWSPRRELGEESRELTVEHTMRLYKGLLRNHEKMRPELLKIFARENLIAKMTMIRNIEEWNRAFREGLD
jgi:adenylate kinase family enzyme